MKKLSMILIPIILIFCSCASGIKGNLGGPEYQKLRTETEKTKYISDFLESIEPGKTEIGEVERKIGFPAKFINLGEGRTIWIYEVTSGTWLLFFGTSSVKSYIFEFKENILTNYYEKKTGSKMGMLYPTIVAEPVL